MRAALPNLESVNVSVHGRDRRQRFQFRQDVGLPHIAPVKDVVYLAEDLEHRVGKPAVRVGDDAEAHLFTALPAGHERQVELHVVNDTLNDEIHELAHFSRPVIKARGSREHGSAGFGDSREVAEVYQGKGSLARHENQRPAFLEGYVSRTFDKRTAGSTGDCCHSPHRAGANDHARTLCRTRSRGRAALIVCEDDDVGPLPSCGGLEFRF